MTALVVASVCPLVATRLRYPVSMKLLKPFNSKTGREETASLAQGCLLLLLHYWKFRLQTVVSGIGIFVVCEGETFRSPSPSLSVPFPQSFPLNKNNTTLAAVGGGGGGGINVSRLPSLEKSRAVVVCGLPGTKLKGSRVSFCFLCSVVFSYGNYRATLPLPLS